MPSPTRPSLLVAVTVKVCDPSVEVSTAEPDAFPFWSRHEAMPGPPAMSAQVKLDVTACPNTYVAPFAGVVIVAVGAR